MICLLCAMKCFSRVATTQQASSQDRCALRIYRLHTCVHGRSPAHLFVPYWLQVVCMSATLNAEKFVEYFGGPEQCSVVSIPGRTFPVEAIFLEEYMRESGRMVGASFG